MYQASTVLTGSEMPALHALGSCAAAGRHPTKRSGMMATSPRVARGWSNAHIVTLLPNLRRCSTTGYFRSKLPEQPAESLDPVVHATAPERIPHDGLMRRHHVDAKLALEHVDRFRRWPVRRRQQ